MQHVLGERNSANYCAIIVDSTSNSSHVEQTTTILSYLGHYESRFKIVKRFLKFIYCSDKTGSAIAQMITETFESHAIPLADCKAQRYDSAASMSGKYTGPHAIIKEQYSTAISLLPVATHLIYVIMMLLNVFQKPTPTSELYKQYTSYSVASLRRGKYWQSIGCSLHGI